ncbi:MAG: hypothetical protein J3Q66DRAFT_418640 [Benniella sp.]|nr:MAG: hypothetical protein J3Q66DRAFT_418640 [Benniella sp.]
MSSRQPQIRRQETTEPLLAVEQTPTVEVLGCAVVYTGKEMQELEPQEVCVNWIIGVVYTIGSYGNKTSGVFKRAKFLSIDRLYHYETVDATRWTEYHQDHVERVAADKDLTLEDPIGFMGVPNINFKPAFNPHSDPNVEISRPLIWKSRLRH